MKNFSKGFVVTMALIITIFGYLQGVVVPEVELKNYNQEASVIGSIFQKKAVQPCVITTLNKCGVVRIIKDTVPDAYQDFLFQTNIPGYNTSFTLDDDATLLNPSALWNNKPLFTPLNGSFNVWESTFGGGYSTTISCVDPTNNTTTAGMTANIAMDNGETITCTFTNTKINTNPTIPPVACAAPNTWTQKADVGGQVRMEGIGFSLAGKGYIGTGTPGNAIAWSDFWEYDPTTNVWTQKANVPGGARAGATGFAIGSKGYVGLGRDAVALSPYLNDFWEYDPATNVWTAKANFPGIARGAASGFAIGSKGYVGLGISYVNGTIYLQDFWEYDPVANAWTAKASFPGVARFHASSFSIGTKGYVGLGSISTNLVTQNDFWEYDPATNVWTAKANFPGPSRTDAFDLSIAGKGYVGGGITTGPIYFQDFWEYNPLTNTWTQKSSLPGIARYGAEGFTINGTGYVGTGESSTPGTNALKDFWCYVP